MPTRIILAPVGAGKTAIALDRLTEVMHTTPLTKVWALFASKRQENAFRQRLIEWDDGRSIYFNVEFFNFYELYQRVLDMAGDPQREINDTSRYSLLHTAITELYDDGQLSVFHTIADTQGFIRIVADFIMELKRTRIYPDVFSAVAAETGRGKDRDLALIYAAYQQKLIAHELVDLEGQGWLAVDALTKQQDLAGDLGLLIVDGFDQFTPVQADLLALLADRADESLITLTTIQGRESTAGRRFVQALDTLKSRFEVGTYAIETPPPGAYANRHPHIQHLVASIFQRKADYPAPPPMNDDDNPRVHLIEAPEPPAEVAAVLREVKRLLLDGESPDEVLIALRDWGRYYTHFTTYQSAYGVPLALHYGQPLPQNPAIAALMTLLTLHENDFRRREVIDLLRSPYFDVPALNQKQIAQLEIVSQRYAVTGSHEQWVDAIARAAFDLLDEDTPSADDESDTLFESVEQSDFLIDDLETFFEAITPDPVNTVSGYIQWLERLIGRDPQQDMDYADDDALEVEQGGFTLDMISRIRDTAAPESIISRDLSAMQVFKRVLRGLLATRELLTSLEGGFEPQVEWATFVTELTTALNNASVDSRPERSGRVLVTTAADARGLPHDHVFIVGMAEGVFPASVPEDPLYLDSERAALSQLGMTLVTQAERAADDGLFYELVCLPRQSLTLSRPTVQDGKPWLESHLWREVKTVFDDIPDYLNTVKLGIGEVVKVQDAASVNEAAVAVAQGMNQPVDKLEQSQIDVYNWLSATSFWAQVHHAYQVESGRLSRAPFDKFSGRLHDAAIIAEAAQAFSPRKAWSASRLNDYGVCGFHFFAKRLLRLETLEEPEIGMDVLQRGTIYHAILERTYQAVIDADLTIAPDNADFALATLENVAADVFANAPEEYSFRPDYAWEQEQAMMLRKLAALVALDFSEKSPIRKKFGTGTRQAFRQEQKFGLQNAPQVEIPLDDDTSLKVLGVVDRIDLIDDRAVVIDYKSGSTKITVDDLKDGRNFQMMVYLLAAQAMLDSQGITVEGGAFWHISNNSADGDLRLDESGLEAIERGKRHILDYMDAGKRGDFAVHATKTEEGRCTRYCEFSHLCRMSSTHRHKR